MKHTNHRQLIAIISILTLLAVGVSAYAYDQGAFAGSPEITEEEAKQIAEEHTGGTAISVELEKEGRTMVYEVTVENATGLWEVEIDADTGDILEVEEDDEDEEDDDDDDDEDEEDDDEDNEEDDDGDDKEDDDDEDEEQASS